MKITLTLCVTHFFLVSYFFYMIFSIGAFFHENEDEAEVAFRSAIEWANIQQRNIELIPFIKYSSPVDSFRASILGKALSLLLHPS